MVRTMAPNAKIYVVEADRRRFPICFRRWIRQCDWSLARMGAKCA